MVRRAPSSARSTEAPGRGHTAGVLLGFPARLEGTPNPPYPRQTRQLLPQTPLPWCPHGGKCSGIPQTPAYLALSCQHLGLLVVFPRPLLHPSICLPNAVGRTSPTDTQEELLLLPGHLTKLQVLLALSHTPHTCMRSALGSSVHTKSVCFPTPGPWDRPPPLPGRPSPRPSSVSATALPCTDAAHCPSPLRLSLLGLSPVTCREPTHHAKRCSLFSGAFPHGLPWPRGRMPVCPQCSKIPPAHQPCREEADEEGRPHAEDGVGRAEQGRRGGVWTGGGRGSYRCPGVLCGFRPAPHLSFPHLPGVLVGGPELSTKPPPTRGAVIVLPTMSVLNKQMFIVNP